MTTEDNQSELLHLILDINPLWWGTKALNTFGLPQYINSIIAFCNCHLMLHSKNEVAIYYIIGDDCQLIWPISSAELNKVELKTAKDGQFEALAIFNEYVRTKILQVVESAEVRKKAVNFSGAIIKSLCYYLRRCKELSPTAVSNLQNAEVVDAAEQGQLLVNDITDNTDGRIVVVKASQDCPTQYLSLMNAIFTAQKFNVAIDCCLIPTMFRDTAVEDSIRASSNAETIRFEHSSLFRQACDLTDGIYLQIPHPSALTQYLISVFLSRKGIRQHLLLPDSRANSVKSGVDFRAACFCHRHLVDVAYVCSVCLAVLCEYSPICVICHSPFKTPFVLKKGEDEEDNVTESGNKATDAPKEKV